MPLETPAGSLHDVREAAEYLGVTLDALRWHRTQTGLMPAPDEVIGKTHYWLPSTLDAFSEVLRNLPRGYSRAENQVTPRMFIEQGLAEEVAAGAIRVTRDGQGVLTLELAEDGYYTATLEDGSEMLIWRNALMNIEPVSG